jgi:hypothetical protein
MQFKEVIAVNNKLEKVCDRYVSVEQYFKLSVNHYILKKKKIMPYLF